VSVPVRVLFFDNAPREPTVQITAICRHGHSSPTAKPYGLQGKIFPEGL
jgi:hypothetical protein